MPKFLEYELKIDNKKRYRRYLQNKLYYQGQKLPGHPAGSLKRASNRYNFLHSSLIVANWAFSIISFFQSKGNDSDQAELLL